MLVALSGCHGGILYLALHASSYLLVAQVLKHGSQLMFITVACSGTHEDVQAISSPSAKGIAYVTPRLVGDKPSWRTHAVD